VAAAALATALLVAPATATAAVAQPVTPSGPASVSEIDVRMSPPMPDVGVPPAAARPTALADPGYTLNLGPDGVPIRWNPCRTNHYRVNAANGGPGALADVTSALAQLTAVSGLQFVDDGPPTEISQSGYGRTQTPDSAPPLLIAWAAASWRGADGVGRALQIVSGVVVLKQAANLAPGFGPANGATRGRVLLHELGHVAGLNHTGDANQVMYSVVDGRAGTCAAGDQAGLARVGA